jgi:bifunctional enzyme CysN/CysC
VTAASSSPNVTWHATQVQRAAGATIWFTGLSGSGKSTIAVTVEQLLVERGRPAYLLDGDNLRHGLNADLGFSEADRVENVRRVAQVARLFADAGLIAIAPLISPYRAGRAEARRIHIDVCESRDPKGLYAKARAGELTGFTGIDDPYEEPLEPDLLLDGDQVTPTEGAERVLSVLLD